MYTNADLTLYSFDNGAYTRRFVNDVFWSDSKQSNVLKTGLSSADSVKVMIPFSRANDLDFTTSRDFVIRGNVAYEVDNTSQQTISASIKYLNDNYETHTITSADKKDYGSESMKHYDLSCK